MNTPAEKPAGEGHVVLKTTVTPEMAEQVTADARRYERSVSATIRAALRAHLKDAA